MLIDMPNVYGLKCYFVPQTLCTIMELAEEIEVNGVKTKCYSLSFLDMREIIVSETVLNEYVKPNQSPEENGEMNG